MPNTFPTLSSGAMVVRGSLLTNSLMKHPATLTSAWSTRVVRFLGDSEQSWTVRRALFSAQLQYTGTHGYDVARVQEFFMARTARYIDIALLNTFTMSILGTVYDWLVFDMDSFDVNEQVGRPGAFDFELAIRQVRPN